MDLKTAHFVENAKRRRIKKISISIIRNTSAERAIIL